MPRTRYLNKKSLAETLALFVDGEHVEPGLLDHILGVGVAARDRAGGAEQALVVAPDQDLEGGAIAGKHARDRRAIVELGAGGGSGHTR